MLSPDSNRSNLAQPPQKLFPQQGVTMASTIRSLQMGHRRLSPVTRLPLKSAFFLHCALTRNGCLFFAPFGAVLGFLLPLQGTSWVGEGLTIPLEPIFGGRCFVFFLSIVLRIVKRKEGGDIFGDLGVERSWVVLVYRLFPICVFCRISG